MAEFDIEHAQALGGIPHGFFGHSGRAYQFGFGGPGQSDMVGAARTAAANAIVAGGSLAAPHQVHSPDVIVVAQAWEDRPNGRPAADALVTAERGIVLGIVTADCGPVLLADAKAEVVGAVHAGWRGAHAGVLENTIAAMEALGAARQDIAAAIGPTIAQASYEVDAPFRENFTSADERHFAPAPSRAGRARWHFDLPSYITDKLRLCGIRKIDSMNRDTFSYPERYYSYRRAVQAEKPNYGRQISMIAVG